MTVDREEGIDIMAEYDKAEGHTFITEYNETAIRDSYRELTNLLIERNLTITTMESATSGQIASLITDTEGASAVFKGAFITYSNEAKIMQGVPAGVIEQYGVYSEETAGIMAIRSQKTYSADIGIGITGTMGNADPANVDSIPGQVYFAIVYKNQIYSYFKKIPMQPSRYAYKLAVAKEVVDVLLPMLQ